MSSELLEDAEALDHVADAAEYLAGLARRDADEDNADRIDGEVKVLRAWARLCRDVASA